MGLKGTGCVSRIRNLLIHLASGAPFQQVLQQYPIGRFFYRISKSKHAKSVILKGALLLKTVGIPSARPTMDIDMLRQGKADQATLVVLVKDRLADDRLSGFPGRRHRWARARSQIRSPRSSRTSGRVRRLATEGPTDGACPSGSSGGSGGESKGVEGTSESARSEYPRRGSCGSPSPRVDGRVSQGTMSVVETFNNR